MEANETELIRKIMEKATAAKKPAYEIMAEDFEIKDQDGRAMDRRLIAARGELTEAFEEPLGQTLLVALHEVLIAKIVKFHTIAQHVVHVGQH